MKYKIDVNQIKSFKSQVKNELHEVDELCKKCYEKIDKSQEVFDTPTSKTFRDKANELILMCQHYVDDSFEPFIDHLDEVAKLYQEAADKIKTSMVTKEDL